MRIRHSHLAKIMRNDTSVAQQYSQEIARFECTMIMINTSQVTQSTKLNNFNTSQCRVSIDKGLFKGLSNKPKLRDKVVVFTKECRTFQGNFLIEEINDQRNSVVLLLGAFHDNNESQY